MDEAVQKLKNESMTQIVQEILKNPPEWMIKQFEIWESTPVDIPFEENDGLQ